MNGELSTFRLPQANANEAEHIVSACFVGRQSGQDASIVALSSRGLLHRFSTTSKISSISGGVVALDSVVASSMSLSSVSVVVGYSDSRVRVFDMETLRESRVLEGRARDPKPSLVPAPVFALACKPEGNLVGIMLEGGTISVRDCSPTASASETLIPIHDFCEGEIWCIELLPAENALVPSRDSCIFPSGTFVTSSDDDVLRFWNFSHASNEGADKWRRWSSQQRRGALLFERPMKDRDDAELNRALKFTLCSCPTAKYLTCGDSSGRLR